MIRCWIMASWSFLTNHARVLMCIAHDPGARLRDIAAGLGITERSAYGIVTELAEAGYVVKQKDGRRNRYQIQAHLPLPEPTSQERTVGEVVALFAAPAGPRPRRPPAHARNRGTASPPPSPVPVRPPQQLTR
jgi:IclR helix-turn-helix domain